MTEKTDIIFVSVLLVANSVGHYHDLYCSS